MIRKVILLGPYPPPYGGVAIFMTALFELTKNRGVSLWAYGDGGAEGTDISFIKFRGLGLIPLLVRGGWKKRVVDSSHFLIEYPDKILVPVWAVLKRLLRAEWLKIVHDGSLPRRHRSFGPIQRLLFRMAIASVDEFVVVSEDLRCWLRDEVKVKRKIHVVKSLLPISHPPPSDALGVEMRSTLARHKMLICSIGVFVPDYGFKQVADSVEQIRAETGEDIGLILLEGGFTDDHNYRREVLRQRDWIAVLRNVPHPEVYRVLERSDVFVRGFRFESYGLSRVEAIWCGLPVVATRVGETRGMLLYDYGDEEGLRRQIKKALFAPPVEETRRWAEQFEREAEENLRVLLKVIESDGD